MLIESAEKKGIKVLYETAAISLLRDKDGVCGVRVRENGTERDLFCKSVVLACGGFESNAEMRARYLGPNWDLAKVRGTRFNTGAGIQMALDIGAMPCGHWSGAHAVGWDQNAPAFGDLAVGDAFQKHSYPFGIMINARGERFLDEGADFRNYTYAKYGREILAQPGQFAWQVFDAKVRNLLRDEYRIRQITKVSSDTLEGLADQMEGVDREGFLRTVAQFNAAVRADVPFNPNLKDGRAAEGIVPRKSHWANTIDSGPFEAYAVTCGVTFTFGGLKIGQDGNVQDTRGRPIPGLFAAGELVGGLFYHNYPGGTGLTSGAVFGKIAGEGAAAAAIMNKSRSAA
jgi:tricarballylate dehydrogenase